MVVYEVDKENKIIGVLHGKEDEMVYCECGEPLYLEELQMFVDDIEEDNKNTTIKEFRFVCKCIVCGRTYKRYMRKIPNENSKD